MQQSVPLLPIPVSSSPRADPKLTKLIAVAGIVAEPDDFVNFWKGLGDKEAERFTLVWETKELIALKNSMVNMILSQVRSLQSIAKSLLAELEQTHLLVGGFLQMYCQTHLSND